MPIIFVHGVAARLYKDHNENWAEIQKNLRRYVAPAISPEPNTVSIEEAFWGKVSVPFDEDVRVSLPDEKRVENIFQHKGNWITRKIKNGDLNLGRALHKLRDAPGNILGREFYDIRKKLNVSVTLFLGDVFFYLANRGTPENPGEITNQLLQALERANENKKERNGEPIVVFSHSMGGQLVYDVVSYYLPEMSKLPKYDNYKDICIDFWCAAGSQVGLFKEMKVFQIDNKANQKIQQDPDASTANASIKFLQTNLGVSARAEQSSQKNIKAPFPGNNKYLKIWWNLWDDNDYLSFTAEPLFEEVFDDLYDSGKGLARAHISHFEDEDFYNDFALVLKDAKEAKWDRKIFLKMVGN